MTLKDLIPKIEFNRDYKSSSDRINSFLLSVITGTCILINGVVLLFTFYSDTASIIQAAFTCTLAGMILSFLYNQGKASQRIFGKNFFIVLCNLSLVVINLLFEIEAGFLFYYLAIAPLSVVLFKPGKKVSYFYSALTVASLVFSLILYSFIPPISSIRPEILYIFQWINPIFSTSLLIIITFNSSRIKSEIISDIERKNKLLTESIERELYLKLQFKSLDEFASIVAHDLKAPLSNLKYLVDRFKSSIQNQETNKLEGLNNTLESCVNNAQSLIESILHYSKANLKNGKLEHFKLVDLFLELENTFKTKGKINFDSSTAPSTIFGNKFQIEQVLLNLIDNAFHHAKYGNTIKITVKELNQGSLVFKVTDFAIGSNIETTKEDDSFEFTPTPPSGSHLGIGLSIVRKLVFQNGGEFGMETTSSIGNIYWFSWPKNQKLTVEKLVFLN
ncbi:sensor histidine kinase [Luteibaculum oceani]|nr:HAMP domain-containing sensor histidine kinase [Luteibaculum oceani]